MGSRAVAVTIRTADRFVPVSGYGIKESLSPFLPMHAVILLAVERSPLQRFLPYLLYFLPHHPDAKGLSSPSEVESLREKVYATLEAYTKQKYPEQPGR